jgi:CubicO group peptidase (beta-lactamase class C family)
LFNALANQNQFNGSVLIAEKGKTIYKSGKGFSNERTKQENNAETVFDLASCSKQFIGVAVALLHRDGQIEYSDDISLYIPELSNYKGVTVYNLLRHTSGIPDFLGGFRKDWRGGGIATNKDVINYYSQSKDTLQFKPSSQHWYSNTNYVLLATIIERVSKLSLNEFLEEKIFEPLRMKRTFVYNRRQNPKDIENYAYGYAWVKNSFEKAPEDDPRVGNVMVYNMDGIVGAGKIHSSVEDLYKWMTAIKSNTLLSPKEFEEVMRITETTDGEAVRYGFGFEVRKKGANFSYGHNGSWDGYSTFIHYNTVKDRLIIVLNNFRYGVAPYRSINEIIDNKPSTKEYKKKVNLPEAEIRKFVGEYTSLETPSEKHNISYLKGHLIYNTDARDWDMRFFPTSGNTFQAIRQSGVDGVMKFTQQADGTMKLEMTQYDHKIGEGVRK